MSSTILSFPSQQGRAFATSREDPEEKAARGAFLPELYRFLGHIVTLPPLREYRKISAGPCSPLARETGT